MLKQPYRRDKLYNSNKRHATVASNASLFARREEQ